MYIAHSTDYCREYINWGGNIKRKKYPAQIRFEKKNPTISFRVKIEEKQKIEHMAKRGKTSVSKLIKNFLLEVDKDFSQAREESYNREYKTGYQKGEWRRI